jgi:NAD(P) transhydrogenase
VQAGKLGKRAAIVEKRQILGGACIETGTIPSKTFREAVLSFIDIGSGFGRADWVRSRVKPSAEQLLDRVDQVMQREVQVVEDQLSRNGVTIMRGEASFKDAHTVIVKSKYGNWEVSAGNIVIAVGTCPSVPSGVPIDGEMIITSDELIHLKKLPRTIVVVGGGIIGIEYASMFAALGIEVTLVDKRERPLEFLDREIVDELIHQMRNRDVIFRLGEVVERLELIDGTPRHAAIYLATGKRIVSDLVLFSVGRIGATGGLSLEAAGLRADERGRLSVDNQFRTEVSHIFAVGDVVGYPNLAATSYEQGRLCACYAFGVETSPMAQHFPIGIYAIPEISMVGAPEHELTQNRVPYEVGIARYREIARGQILGDDSGLLKMLFHRDSRQLLGVHAIGTGATELIHIGQAVMALGGGLEYFLQTVFNYPTLAECYKVAALDAANKLCN